MKKVIYILTIAMILTGISCSEDMLELSNPNRLSTKAFWQSEDDALLGVNSIYNCLYEDGLYKRLYLWVMDVRADDFRNTSPWWITAVSQYQTSPDNMCYYKPYSQLYTSIWRANQVLENVPGIEMDEELKTRFLAEAYFFRGLFHYNLVVMYKNIPLITETPKKTEDYFPYQAPESLVWQQIISDFTMARDGLWNKDEYETKDLGRATKAAAAGMLAKAYMFIQEWDLARIELEKIVAGDYGTYTLVADYSDNFTLRNENNTESLFEVQFDANLSGTTQNWANEPSSNWTKTSGKARTYAPTAHGGYGDITPTNWIFQEFKKELTVDSLPDPRLYKSIHYYNSPDSIFYGKKWGDWHTTDITSIYVRKYLNDRTLTTEVEWRSSINERVLRYADILLLLAECLNELDRTNEAYTHIQTVRNRANLPDLATVKPNMTKDEMRLQIAHERGLEFCFEGKRYVDLLRWGWLKIEESGAHSPMLDTLIMHDPEIARLTYGREYMAIPQKELDANPNLVQNPGWD